MSLMGRKSRRAGVSGSGVSLVNDRGRGVVADEVNAEPKDGEQSSDEARGGGGREAEVA